MISENYIEIWNSLEDLFTVTLPVCVCVCVCNTASNGPKSEKCINTLRTGEADLRFYITTVQDGWRKPAFLTRACFPCTINLIMQYIEPVSEWSC